MAFQATKRSMRTSAGFRSWSWIFFFMRLWFLDNEEPFLLRPLAREFAREMLVCSGWPDNMMGKEKGLKLSYMSLVQIDVRWTKLGTNKHHTIADVALNTLAYYLIPYHEFRNTEPRHLPRCNARFVPLYPFPGLPLNYLNSCTEDTFRWPTGTQLCPHWICRFSTRHAWCILLCLHDCTTQLIISNLPHLMTCHQIKRKNDQTVLKYGKSTFYR